MICNTMPNFINIISLKYRLAARLPLKRNFQFIFIIISLIISDRNVYAQTSTNTDNSMKYNNSANPSMSVNSGISPGSNLSVDLYTGKLQCSLPIYTLGSADFTNSYFN